MSEQFPKFFYQSLLELYPKPYRREYGSEMTILFEDLYQEEISQKKEISFSFWWHLLWDVVVSTLAQHKQLLQRIGLKKYLTSAFSPNTFIFLLSLILLAPFISLMSLDTGTVLLTGSREAMTYFYDSPYWPAVIIITVLILPLVTVLINGFILVQSTSKYKYHFLTVTYISQNFFNLLVFGAGTFAIFMLFGHDFIPCLVNHTLKSGLQNFIPNLNYCRLYS